MEQVNGDKWYSLGDNTLKWAEVKGLAAGARHAAGHAPSAFTVVTWSHLDLAPWAKTWGMTGYGSAFTNVCSSAGTQASSSCLLVFPPGELPSACYSAFMHSLWLLVTLKAFLSPLFNSRFVWSVITQSQAHTPHRENNHFLVTASNYLKNIELLVNQEHFEPKAFLAASTRENVFCTRPERRAWQP